MTRLKNWFLTNVVAILLVVSFALATALVVQTVQLDGLKVGPVTIVEGCRAKAGKVREANARADREASARVREGAQGDKSYNEQAVTCRETATRARTSGRLIEEVIHVPVDPTPSAPPAPDGGIIPADRLRAILGQDAAANATG